MYKLFQLMYNQIRTIVQFKEGVKLNWQKDVMTVKKQRRLF